METTKLAVSVSEAAAMLSISRPTMYAILNRADFKGSFYVGSKHLVSVSALADWVDRQVEVTE